MSISSSGFVSSSKVKAIFGPPSKAGVSSPAGGFVVAHRNVMHALPVLGGGTPAPFRSHGQVALSSVCDNVCTNKNHASVLCALFQGTFVEE